MDIVVGALSAMVDALPVKLGKLLEKEHALPSGVRGDVVFLQAELSSMRAAIQHSESLDDCDPHTRAWINRVRELAYDMEDWVDNLLATIHADAGAGAGGSNPPSSSTGFMGWIRRSANKLTALPEHHVVELQGLKERVVELSEQRNRYSLAALSFSTMARPVDVRLAAPYVDPTSLVGLDRPVKRVSKMVTEGSDVDLKVISIVGMVGSGKTTLAAAVYKQLQQDKCFDCHCFVYVGQEQGAPSKTLKNMLSHLLGYMPRGDQDIAQLISSVRETLRNKRYLIVVDDLWSREQWVTISLCFPKNQLGSRVITTARDDELTRDSSVGSRDDTVYKIGLLSDADSEKLFLKKVFGTSRLDCPQHLEDSCAKILTRCGGLPLALVSVASILVHSSQTTEEWMKLALDSLWSSRVGALQQVLSRCLNDLVPHLRTCMLYLSIFPEYTEVEVERLMRRWVAEGFIDKGSSSTPEETARGYLDKLIIRNMIQPLDVKHNGFPRPRYCKIHPMIHDFIVCKSMEENFVTLVDEAQAHNNQYAPINNSTVRRLSVRSSSKGPMVPNESTDLSHARSITVFGHANATPCLTVMKVVRVLDLEGCSGPLSCLDGLPNLLLLRYLSLKGTDISELPETTGDLRCLETLDVRFTKVEKLPISIFRLEKMKHLLSGSAKLPSGMAKMKALQTLSCAVVTQSCTNSNIIQEISRHDELRELELFCDVAAMPEVKHQIIFPHDGFQTLKELHIHCSLESVVTFEPNVLPRVEVLELMFERGHADGSSAVSGIENLLPNLKYVLIDFFKHDAGAEATVNAVTNAADKVRYNRVMSIKVPGKSYYYQYLVENPVDMMY